MRRLSFLLVALAVGLYGARLITGTDPLAADPLAAIALRDGALVLGLATLIFGLNSTKRRSLSLHAVSYRWPALGRTLALTGILSALAGGLLFAVDGAGTTLATARVTLWLLGLGLVVAGVVWRGAAQRYAMPGYRWQRLPSGEFERVPVARSDAGATLPDGDDALLDLYLPGHIIWLAAAIGVGILVRVWQLWSLPGGCVDLECTLALDLLDGAAARAVAFNPLFALATVLQSWLDNPIHSLRSAAALFGIGAVVVAYPVLRRIASPAAALAGVLLLALSPLHLGAGRMSHLELPAVLWLLLALWFTWRGLRAGLRTDWTLAGLALGLTALTVPPLLPGLAAWAVLLGVLAFLAQDNWVDSWRLTPLGLFAAGVLLPVLPLLATGAWTGTGDGSDVVVLAIGTAGLALAVLGVGAVLRGLRRVEAGALVSGSAAILGSLLMLNRELLASRDLLLMLLPFGLAAGTVAVDQLLTALVSGWRVLVRPPRLAVGAVGILALFLLGGLAGLRGTLTDAGGRAANPADRAMLAAATAALSAPDSAGAVYFVPPGVLASADARLLARSALETGQLRSLDSVLSVLAAGDRPVHVLVSPVTRAWQELLLAYFPDALATPHFDEANGALLYTEVTVPTQVTAETVLDGANITGDWHGSLLVPVSGTYNFAVTGTGAGAGTAVTLLLDHRLVLDSALGRTTATETLAEGVYTMELRVLGEPAPGAVTLTWVRPDGVAEPVPATALIDRVLPNLGLLATYYATDNFQPPALTLRKDLLLGNTPSQAWPTSVVWTGQLAANRAGEYLLAAVADGRVTALVDGRQIFLLDPHDPAETTAGFAEGSLYLEPGWHALEVRFAPATRDSELQLLWQPPGGQPTALSPLYLRPVGGTLTTRDEALPPAPQLTDPRLARGDFALTQGIELRQTTGGLLPEWLPALPAAQLWRTDTGCGAAPEQLNRPHGIAFDTASGRLYVADTGNARIAVFALDGAPLSPLRSDELVEPVDIGLFSDGTLAVLDAMRQQVIHLDLGRGEAAPIGAADLFYRPRGLAVLPGDVLAVADTGGGRVVLLTATGDRLLEYGGRDSALAKGQPVDVLGAGQDLWAVTAEDGRLWEVNIPGAVMVAARAVTIDGSQLAGLPDGSFFLSDPARRQILYHEPGGRPAGQIAYPDAFELPTGLAAAQADGDTLLAVVDTARCALSLWQIARP